jgi:hypothetical protein
VLGKERIPASHGAYYVLDKAACEVGEEDEDGGEKEHEDAISLTLIHLSNSRDDHPRPLHSPFASFHLTEPIQGLAEGQVAHL